MTASPVTIGYVEQRQLRFHKRSVDGSAKADAAFTAVPSDRVWGVVYRLSRDEKPELDKHEFLGIGYDQELVAVNIENGSIMQRLSTPFSSLYGNILKTHDYDNDQLLKNAVEWFQGEMDVVSFYLNQDQDQEISMSFHLTELDKKKILSLFGDL